MAKLSTSQLSPIWHVIKKTSADFKDASKTASSVLLETVDGKFVHAAFAKVTTAFAIGEQSIGQLSMNVYDGSTSLLQGVVGDDGIPVGSADIETALATDGIFPVTGDISVSLDFTPADAETWNDVDSGEIEIYLLLSF